MNKYVPSRSCLIRLMPNNMGYSMVGNIPLDKVALVILGGSVTTDEKRASGYIEHIEPVLKNSNIKDVNIYSAVYSFGSLDSDLLKINLFRRAGRKIKNAIQQEQKLNQINENEPVPEYVLDLYDEIIEPRIVIGDVATTILNMRSLIFYNHCHGAVALRLLSEVTHKELKNAGFDDKSVSAILKSIVAIQHNPVGPLETPEVTTINFLSASDDVLEYHNPFSDHVMGVHNLEPSFFGETYGNVFVAGKLNIHQGAEHGFSDGYKSDSRMRLTQNGQIIFRAEQNALRNVIIAAQDKAPIPNIEQCVSDDIVDFNAMKSSGDKLSSAMMGIRPMSKNNHQK